jgi:hypothetical protein
MKNQVAKIFLVAALLITISSCERKSCQNVACPVGQACNNGRCFCADGYEGANCDVESWTKYTSGLLSGSGSKSWNVTESCYSVPQPNFPSYTAFITHNSSYPNVIEINNMMGGYCGQVIGYIRTDQSNQGNIIEIQTQSCGSLTLNGQGTWDPNYHRITFQLNYTFNGLSYQCTQTFY